VPDLAIIAELNLCSGLCMLGRWAHGHAAIKRCTWIKRTDGVTLQHIKRVVSKYILILQRTTSILKISPLEESSALSVAVWPLIHCKYSPSISPSLSAQSLRHMSLSSNMEEMRLIESPLASNLSSPSPASAFSSPHLAGKLRPGSAGLLRPVSAMSAVSQASNLSFGTLESTVMLHSARAIPSSAHRSTSPLLFHAAHALQVASTNSSRPASAALPTPHALRMMSPDAVARLRLRALSTTVFHFRSRSPSDI
jgi:hypothetical protein